MYSCNNHFISNLKTPTRVCFKRSWSSLLFLGNSGFSILMDFICISPNYGFAHKSHMIGAKPCNTSCSSSSKLSIFDGSPLVDPTEYCSIVGELQYCMLTRLDISFSANQLCQFMHSPTDKHWTAAKRVLRYLKAIIDHGLHYSKSSLQLNAFCDSD